MFVPVVFAFDYAQAHYRVVHLAQRLVEPFVFAGIGESLLVDDLHRGIKNIQAGFVGICLGGISHRGDLNVSGSHVNSEPRSLRTGALRAYRWLVMANSRAA